MLAAAVAGVCSYAQAQTSGTWGADVGTTGGSWSDPANWVAGSVADNGGVASFVTLPTFTTAPVNIIQDLANVTVNQMTFDTNITYLLKPGTAGNTITLSGPATIDTPRPSITTISTTTFGHQSQNILAGTSGLTKTGPGTFTLWIANTFSGDVNVNGGVLVARQTGDPAFGNAANQINVNGGTIRVTTTGWTSSRNINLLGPATFESGTSQNITLNGPIGGAGALNKIGSNGLILTAANNYSGATNLLAGTMSLSGNGALAGTSSLTLRNTITLDNAATSSSNRINDAAPVTYLGSGLTLTGSAAGSTTETLGDTTFSRGTTTITVTPGAGQSAGVFHGTMSRDTGAAMFVRGASLGATPGANVANVTFAAAPALIGGGGAAGSTSISIVPWGWGSTNAAAPANDINNSLMTYGANGLRPLNTATEYAAAISAGVSQDNIRITGAQTVASPSTINSLVIAGAGGIDGAGPLTITSGALLNLQNGVNVSAPLNFGIREAMIMAPSSITFSGVISGGGGLSKQGAGVATFAASNNYTGVTTIGGGTAAFTTNVPGIPSTPGPFGASDTAIVLAPAGLGTGGTTARLVYAAPGTGTFDRDLLVSGRIALNNAATIPGFGAAAGSTLDMNGDITLDASPLTFIGGAGSTVNIIGDIIGTGGPITDQGGAPNIVLSGNNTFVGGVEMSNGITWSVGSDSAFGSGLLKMVQTSGQPTIQAVGGARIVSNDTVAFSFSANYWQIGGSNPIDFTGDINLSGSYTHIINNTALTTYSGQLHTGGFTKSGTGVLLLSGNNIYSGNTTISSGVLRVSNSGALGSSAAPTIVNSGAAMELTGGALTAEPVTLAGPGVASGGALRNLSGSNAVGAVTLSSGATIAVDAGQLTAGNVSGTPFPLTKNGPGTLTANRFRVLTMNVADGDAVVAPGRSTDKTSTLFSNAGADAVTVAAGATLDLGDNDLAVEYNGASQLTNIRNLISSAYTGGAWSGSGITSSLANASNFALGYGESSEVFTSFPANFSGVDVDDSAILVRYTRYGDADLSGTVNSDDFNRLASSFGTNGNVWTGGNFNFDPAGLVDSDDFNLLATNFGLSATGPNGTVTPQDWANLAAAVPEPAAGIGIAAAMMVLIRRRRK